MNSRNVTIENIFFIPQLQQQTCLIATPLPTSTVTNTLYLLIYFREFFLRLTFKHVFKQISNLPRGAGLPKGRFSISGITGSWSGHRKTWTVLSHVQQRCRTRAVNLTQRKLPKLPIKCAEARIPSVFLHKMTNRMTALNPK